MKAAKPGQTVGIALEAFDGKEGEVLCYVTLGQGNSGKAIAKLENEFQLAKTENKELKLKLGQLEEQLNELAQLVKGDHKFAEVIDADK